MGAQLLIGQPFTLVEADIGVNGSTVQLTLNSRATMFIPSAVIDGQRTLEFVGLVNLYSTFKFRFEMDAIGNLLVLPDNVVMSDPLWDAGLKTWTCVDAGEFEMTATYDGTNWNVTILGPYT